MTIFAHLPWYNRSKFLIIELMCYDDLLKVTILRESWPCLFVTCKTVKATCSYSRKLLRQLTFYQQNASVSRHTVYHFCSLGGAYRAG